MALNFGIGFVIRATDLASGVLRRVTRGFGALGGSAQQASGVVAAAVGLMGTGIGALTIGLKGLRAAFGAAVEAGEFSQTVQFLGAITDRTGEALGELRQRAVDASLATQFSPTEAIQGLKRLVTGGLNAAKSMDALQSSLNLATIGNISVASASTALITGLNAFGREGLSAEQITDRFANIMAKTNFQATDFEAGLAVAAGTMSGFNQTLDTTLVSLGMMRNAGFVASRAATAVREATRRMAGNQSVMNRLTEMQIELFEEDGKTMRQLPDLIFDIEKAFKKMTPAQAQVAKMHIFGARGVAAFNVMTQQQIEVMQDGQKVMLQGADAVRHLMQTQLESAGQAQKIQDRILDTFEGQRRLIQGIVQGFRTELGEGLARFLKPAAKLVKEFAEAVVRVIGALPPQVKSAAVGLFVLGSAILAVAGAMSIFAAIAAISLPFMGVILPLVAGITVAFVAMLHAAVALAAGVGLLVARFSNFTSVAQFTETLSRKAGLLFDTLKQLFTLGGVKLELMQELKRAGNEGVLPLAVKIFGLVERLKDFFGALIGVFKGAAKHARMSGIIDQLGKSFSTVAEIIGFFTEESNDSLTNVQAWKVAGMRVGITLARMGLAALEVILRIKQLSDGFMSVFGPAVMIVVDAINLLVRGLLWVASIFTGGLSNDVDFHAQRWQFLGKVLGAFAAIKLFGVIAGFGLVKGIISKVALTWLPFLLGKVVALTRGIGLLSLVTSAAALPFLAVAAAIAAVAFAIQQVMQALDDPNQTVAAKLFGLGETEIGGELAGGGRRAAGRGIGAGLEKTEADGTVTSAREAAAAGAGGPNVAALDEDQLGQFMELLRANQQSDDRRGRDLKNTLERVVAAPAASGIFDNPEPF